MNPINKNKSYSLLLTTKEFSHVRILEFNLKKNSSSYKAMEMLGLEYTMSFSAFPARNSNLREPQKKSFFSGQSTNAFSPHPRAKWSKERLQNKLIKRSLFLSGQSLTPPPILVDCPLKKERKKMLRLP